MTKRHSSDKLYQHAKEYLTSINERLIVRCPDYRVSLDFFSEIKEYEVNSYVEPENLKDKHLLLCLFHNDVCVSSLILDTEKDKDGTMNMSIDSKTKQDYQNRKFNKFLRAIVVMLAKLINPDIKFVVSYAHNPLAAKTMVKYFDADSYNMYKNDPIIGFDEDIPITYSTRKLLSLLSNSKGDFGLIIKVELNEKNQEKADAIINKLIEGSGLICDENDVLTETSHTSPRGGKNTKTLKHQKRKKKRKTLKHKKRNQKKKASKKEKS